MGRTAKRICWIAVYLSIVLRCCNDWLNSFARAVPRKLQMVGFVCFLRCCCNFSIVLPLPHSSYTTTCLSGVLLSKPTRSISLEHLVSACMRSAFNRGKIKIKYDFFNSCFNFYYSVSQHVHTLQTIKSVFCLRLLAAVRRFFLNASFSFYLRFSLYISCRTGRHQV